MSKTLRTICILGALLSSAAVPAWAGNVFMKNGYIIQGPIVERADGSIVLGWPNGKVTIHQRFIESIVYEPNEEKQLQELESHAASDTPNEDSIGILGTAEEPEELPMDPESLVRKFVINTNKPPKEEGEENGAGNGGKPGDGSQVEVTSIPGPSELLGDRFEDESLGLAFRPPKGWVAERKLDAVQAAPATLEGFRASINIVRVAKGALVASDYAVVLKEENARLLQDFELLSEGPRSQGKLSAHEILGRGTRSGRTAVVRQILVEGKDSLWLVSSFVPAVGGELAAPLIEESLRTLELTDK